MRYLLLICTDPSAQLSREQGAPARAALTRNGTGQFSGVGWGPVGLCRIDGFSGSPPWPGRLRIRGLANTEIYSLTWNFAAPDGRATFHLDKSEAGEPILVWRRIGDHGIYDRP
jgi:hypothetical protein